MKLPWKKRTQPTSWTYSEEWEAEIAFSKIVFRAHITVSGKESVSPGEISGSLTICHSAPRRICAVEHKHGAMDRIHSAGTEQVMLLDDTFKDTMIAKAAIENYILKLGLAIVDKFDRGNNDA